MVALTLWRPWAYAVTHLGKRTLNRSWRPPPSLLGKRFALHAGKLYCADDASIGGSAPPTLGCYAWIEETFGVYVPPAAGQAVGVVATALYLGTAAELGLEHDPWYVGPVGWVLGEVAVLEQPILCPGHQGLWKLSKADARRLAA